MADDRPDRAPARPGRSALIAYFASGWVFLIPYVVIYWLYAWMQWPVLPDATRTAPSLLTVYWGMHVSHVLLGAACLLGQCRRSGPWDTGEILRRGLPWLGLALLFYLPGAYLEWPSDPWEHLRRIAEWPAHAFVREHSASSKSFYFFAYSLLGDARGSLSLGRLDLYYTGVSLLLAWQYFRLGRALGLERAWAYLFALGTTLMLGNSSFSFYRYYGLATTVYAQIGAVALTRLAFGSAGGEKWLGRCGRIAAVLALLALIGSNHVQGIGIAALGIAAVGFHRLAQWRPAALLVAGAALLVVSLAMLAWLPRHPLVSGEFRTEGWLSAWYGFQLTWPSPASDRAQQIIGAAGVLNLLFGLLLLRRNHPAGWLTVLPVMALILPCVGLPLANILAAKGGSLEIVTFHRMLFAIPSGLAMICWLREAHRRNLRTCGSGGARERLARFGFTAAAGASVLVVAVPLTRYDQRSWHLGAVVPGDLQLRPALEIVQGAVPALRSSELERPLAVGPSTAFLFSTLVPERYAPVARLLGQAPAPHLERAVIAVQGQRPPAEINFGSQAPESPQWITLGGVAPVSGRDSASVLASPPGERSDVFTSELIPIDPAWRYWVQAAVRRQGSGEAKAFLAIAWYDEAGRWLISDNAGVAGADSPTGWVNGTYSYFGLIGTAAPSAWTVYRAAFGAGEEAVIPPRARFVRLGALLNYENTAAAQVLLSDMRLGRKAANDGILAGVFPAPETLLQVSVDRRALWTPSSQAGELSGHWPAQRAALDQAGHREMASPVRTPPRALQETESPR